MDQKSVEFVSHIVQERPAEKTAELYTTWIENYDKAMININYNGPRVTAEEFSKLGLDKSVRILDVGAGTGALGMELKGKGYDNLDALEPSEMITTAMNRRVYKNYFKGYVKLGHPLSIAPGTYDVAIMVGVITPGHIHIEDLKEVAKVVKSGGILCWVGSQHGFYEKQSAKYTSEVLNKAMEDYVNQGIWEYAQKPVEVPDYYKTKAGVFYAMKIK